MPEARSSERRPIVPDPDSSLTRSRRHASPSPRLWPLKFAVLLLLASLIVVVWLGWHERMRLEAQVQQISSAMSNVHARFDAEEGRGDRLENIESRLASVEDHAESMVARLASQEVEVRQVVERDTSRFEAIDERLDDTVARLDTLIEEADTRDALISAVRTSLDSLERAGVEGREALAERVAALDAANQRQTARLEALQQRQEELAEALQEAEAGFEARLATLGERMQTRHDELGTRIQGLSEGLEGMSSEMEALAGREAGEQTVGQIQARLSSMETELRELRQEQLTLSAGLEALQ
ncbi:hypothetical protein F0A17_03635 [Billgrantia pellis]|uniref:Uncharacterized protein n=1 Tax=Billgrantia pellis TaxID=2606936 RepID=A0A7V7G1I0_9GAMM|nr:hypothetical protein [Halomonas pellis]KAA0013468.1 hypothetical protein F0A17_03635 [Halomonas pellis]